MRIVFMGTPEFAVPSLKILVESGYEVIAAVTQMDKPKDRGHSLKAPPVKEYALSVNIPVLQPQKLTKEPEMVEKIKELAPDLIITCAFGQLLPQSVLDIPRLGTINVHGSLLPKYRGAAPIQRALINGENKTGITTMLTEIGMDTGDMLLKDEMEIPIDMTYGDLHDMMSELGAQTLLKTLKSLERGELKPVKQDDSQATRAMKIDKETGFIDWNKSSLEIHNLVRGTNPWPGSYAFFEGTKMRIWKTESIDDTAKEGEPGEIVKVDQKGMTIQTGSGKLLVIEIQMESGKRMTPYQYSLGHPLKAGMKLIGKGEQA